MSAPYYSSEQVTLHVGRAVDVLATMPTGSVQCIVTSPPYYGLRDYGVADQLGAEATPAEYVEAIRATMHEARRVLADDGTLWLNLGDTYYSGRGASTGVDKKNPARRGFLRAVDKPGQPWATPKSLLMLPARTAIALQDDGWTLRNDIVWEKPNAMPEPVRDRLSNRYEHVYLFSKSRRYWFDLDAIRVPLVRPEAVREGIVFGGSNKRQQGRVGSSARRTGSTYAPTSGKGKNPGDVWSISTRPFKGAHFATFPLDLPRRCITAGCPKGGTVLDTFSGSATTGAAALELGRKYVGIDVNPEYHDLALSTRLANYTIGE